MNKLCRRNPGLTATIADFPPVLSRTAEVVREHGLDGRVTLLPCNITDASFKPHDVVLAFNILHGFRPEVNRSLLEKIRSTLKPGGRLYADFCAAMVVDRRDALSVPGVEALGMRAVLAETVMDRLEAAVLLAALVRDELGFDDDRAGLPAYAEGGCVR